MNGARLADYLGRMPQAAMEARGFIEGMSRTEFLADRRTQQAVVMSPVIIGEAATRLMERHGDFARAHPEIPWREMKGGCETEWPMAISRPISGSSGRPSSAKFHLSPIGSPG